MLTSLALSLPSFYFFTALCVCTHSILVQMRDEVPPAMIDIRVTTEVDGESQMGIVSGASSEADWKSGM